MKTLGALAALVLILALGLVHELAAPPPVVTGTHAPPPMTTSAPHIAIAGAMGQPMEQLPEALLPRTPIMVTPLSTQPASPPSYPDTTPPPHF